MNEQKQEKKTKLLGLPWFTASRCERCTKRPEGFEGLEKEHCDCIELCMQAEQIHIQQEVADNLDQITKEVAKLREVLITLENPDWRPEG